MSNQIFLTIKMINLLILTVLVISGNAIANNLENEKVLNLNNDNFDQAVAQHHYILVQFYAPSCSHCKTLAPEYSKAAEELSLKESEIKLAKVDATKEVELADRYGVDRYPTLKFFIGGRQTEFNGGRTSERIVSWLEKRTSPPQIVSSLEELDSFINNNTVVVAGFLSDLTTSLTKAFLDTAQYIENVPFISLHDPTLFAAHNITEDLIMMFKKFDERKTYYSGETTLESLTNFVEINSIPLVVDFNYDLAPMIFGRSIKNHVLLFIPTKSEGFQSIKEAITNIANDYKGKLLFVTVDSEREELKPILEFFGVAENEIPAIRITTVGKGMKKYKASDVSTELAIRSFIDQFLAGQLNPDLLSEEIPENWDDGQVKILVGKNFNSVVNSSNKSVLVMFYAPWCGHCKQLLPLWDELGERFKNSTDVMIAKIDSTKNELDDTEIKAFPTIKLYINGGMVGKDYNGERTVEGLVSFITSDGMDGGAVDEDKFEDYDEADNHDEL